MPVPRAMGHAHGEFPCIKPCIKGLATISDNCQKIKGLRSVPRNYVLFQFLGLLTITVNCDMRDVARFGNCLILLEKAAQKFSYFFQSYVKNLHKIGLFRCSSGFGVEPDPVFAK